jgi:hypothetical protein
MSDEKKEALKCAGIGPGGLNCRCCVPYSNKKLNKRLVSKAARRISKSKVRAPRYRSSWNDLEEAVDLIEAEMKTEAESEPNEVETEEMKNG